MLVELLKELNIETVIELRMDAGRFDDADDDDTRPQILQKNEITPNVVSVPYTRVDLQSIVKFI